jgi:hypothetical protein
MTSVCKESLIRLEVAIVEIPFEVFSKLSQFENIISGHDKSAFVKHGSGIEDLHCDEA